MSQGELRGGRWSMWGGGSSGGALEHGQRVLRCNQAQEVDMHRQTIALTLGLLCGLASLVPRARRRPPRSASRRHTLLASMPISTSTRS